MGAPPSTRFQPVVQLIRWQLTRAHGTRLGAASPSYGAAILPITPSEVAASISEVDDPIWIAQSHQSRPMRDRTWDAVSILGLMGGRYRRVAGPPAKSWQRMRSAR